MTIKVCKKKFENSCEKIENSFNELFFYAPILLLIIGSVSTVLLALDLTPGVIFPFALIGCLFGFIFGAIFGLMQPLMYEGNCFSELNKKLHFFEWNEDC